MLQLDVPLLILNEHKLSSMIMSIIARKLASSYWRMCFSTRWKQFMISGLLAGCLGEAKANKTIFTECYNQDQSVKAVMSK